MGECIRCRFRDLSGDMFRPVGVKPTPAAPPAAVSEEDGPDVMTNAGLTWLRAQVVDPGGTPPGVVAGHARCEMLRLIDSVLADRATRPAVDWAAVERVLMSAEVMGAVDRESARAFDEGATLREYGQRVIKAAIARARGVMNLTQCLDFGAKQ